jgi:hypothetical protein
VRDDGLPVLGDLDVQLQRGNPKAKGIPERAEGVLGPEPDTAPVGLDVEVTSAVAVLSGSAGIRDRRPAEQK